MESLLRGEQWVTMVTAPLCLLLLLWTNEVMSQQAFTLEPADAETKRGESRILECRVDRLQGTVQWTRDGWALGTNPELPGYPRYSLVGAKEMGTYNLLIANAQLEDDAVFQCQVGATAFSAGLRSRPAVHTVLIPPEKPLIENGTAATVEVIADVPVNLSCLARAARPAANVSWHTGGRPLADDVTTASSRHAKLEDVVAELALLPRRSDAGRTYECRAENAALTFAKVARVALVVLFRPDVSLSASPARRLQDGGSLTLTCTAAANPAAVTWAWYKGDVVEAGATSDELVMDNLTPDDHGLKVSCEATNTVGSTRHTYTLNVEYGPRFKADPVHVAVDAGADAELTCTVDANPAPAVYWTRKDAPQILGSSSTYRIDNAQEADFGVYTCTATSSGFPEQKQEVHLLQNGPPAILGELEQFAAFGSVGTLECVVRSVPPPKAIVWEQDGKPLDFSALDRYTVREEDLLDGKRSVVEISSVQDADYGAYNCSLSNGYGSATAEITFAKKEVIPLAYILAAAVVGVVIILVLIAILVIYFRRRASGSESGSESSEDSLQKRDDRTEPKLDGKFDVYGNPIDAWRTDYGTSDQYRYSAEYDELNYQNKDRANKSYDYGDGYGNQGYNVNRQGDTYGTYPGAASRVYNDRFTAENPYGPSHPPSTHAPSVHSEYGTYRGYHPANDLPPPPPPASDYGMHSDFQAPPPNSRLSTNV